MIGAPRASASSTNGHRCGFDVSVFVPQSSTRSLSRNPFRVGADVRADRHPHADRARPSSRSCGRASTRRWSGRTGGRSTIPARCPSCRRTSTAGSLAGRRRNARISFRRVAISSSASSHEIRANFPEPFRADAAHRMEQPVLVIRALDVPVDLRAEEAARERMLRVARDAHGAPRLHRDEHGARVGAVVRARAADDALRGLRIVRRGRDGGRHVRQARRVGEHEPAPMGRSDRAPVQGTRCPGPTCPTVERSLTGPPGPISFTPLTPSPRRVHEPRGYYRPTLQEIVMKRLAFVAAVLAIVAACSKSESAAKDTTPPAMAPAPVGRACLTPE